MTVVECNDGHIWIRFGKAGLLDTGLTPKEIVDLYPGIPVMNQKVVVVRLPNAPDMVNIYYYINVIETMHCAQTTNTDLTNWVST